MPEPERDWWRACFPTFMRGVDWTVGSRPARWLRRSWVRLLKWTLVILLVLGVAHTIVSIHVSERLGAKLEALRAAGKLVYRTDTEPPVVSDPENAAPLYAAAAAWARLHDRARGWDPTAATGPESGLLIGYRDIVTRDGDLRRLSSQESASLRRMVELDRPALGLIRQGAARPHCRLPLDVGDRYAPDLGQSKLHLVQRLLTANALVAGRTGQDELALECLRLGFVVGRHMADQPTVMGGLGSARATARDAMVPVAHLLPGLHLSGTDAKALAQELARVDGGPTLTQRWDQERTEGLRRFSALGGPEAERYFSVWEDAMVPRFLRPWFWQHYSKGLLRPWFELDELEYLRQMDRWEPILQASVRERAEAWRNTPDDWGSPHAPWWAPVTRHTAWSPVGWVRELDSWRTSCDLLRVVLGLERYRQEHGGYPASLGQLRAGGWEVPKDRFSEADFVYRRRGTTFLLYSIGPNLQDEGGQPGEWPFSRWDDAAYKAPPQDDIVWEYRPVMRRRSPHR